jgi:hypothetical protein
MESFEGQPAPPAAPGTRTAHAVVIALVITAALSVGLLSLAAVIATRDHEKLVLQTTNVGPKRGDHWHAALGVNDCGRWLPNWLTPTSATDDQFRGGMPVQAGTNDYAGLHSHGDALIHMEPVSTQDMGKNATLGRYVTYAGFELTETSIDFADVHDSNGESCDGEPGVLRWAVNGTERHGDPADYKLLNGDVIELVFTTADAPLPPQTAVPSYAELREMIGLPV